jgi:hypothetical protein
VGCSSEAQQGVGLHKMSAPLSLPGTARVLQPIINGQKLAKTLYIDTAHLDRCVELWSSGAFDELGLESYDNNYKLNDTDVLQRFPKLTRLHINLDRPIDLSGLSHAAEFLVGLNINDDINTIADLTPFTSIERLGFRWNPKTRFPNAMPALRELGLSHFKPDTKDLTTLPHMPSLAHFGLTVAHLESLIGLERLRELQHLQLYRVQGLTSIEEIGALQGLRELDIEGCKGSFDLASALNQSTHLITVRYSRSAPLSSLRFIAQLPKLKHLAFLDTEVEDGDMSPLATHQSLRHVAFTKKKHFSHSDRQLNALYAGRPTK